MKNTIRTLTGAAALLAAVTFQPIAFGQEAVTTTTANGTISEFTPGGDTVVLHGEGSDSPMRYTYSKSTTVVDDAGNPVDVSVVKSGVPVQVYYDRDGDNMVARKIVVHRHETTDAPAAVTTERTTTTTTTSGDHDHDHDHDHDK